MRQFREEGTVRGEVWRQGGRIFEKLKETHFHLIISLPPRKTGGPEKEPLDLLTAGSGLKGPPWWPCSEVVLCLHWGHASHGPSQWLSHSDPEGRTLRWPCWNFQKHTLHLRSSFPPPSYSPCLSALLFLCPSILPSPLPAPSPKGGSGVVVQQLSQPSPYFPRQAVPSVHLWHV